MKSIMKQETLQLTGANYNNDRRALDFYPTPVECTVALLDVLHLSGVKRIMEPACGNGAISDVLRSYGFVAYSSDIQTDYGVVRDFFEIPTTEKFDAVITNPPFNLSMQFIEKSLQHAPIVAMLLKSQYWHAKTRLDFFQKNLPAYVFPLTWRPDFLGGEKGGKPTMECAWTVWMPGTYVTQYVPLKKPKSDN